MTRLETDRLIGRLAQGAAIEDPGVSPRVVLLAASLAAFVVALALALGVTVLATGEPLPSPAPPWLAWKLLCMGALGFAAFALVRELARPGYERPRFGLLSGGVVLLALGAVVDPSGLSLAGQSMVSVPVCLAAIVGLSLPGMVLILVGLRRSTTSTRPGLTGAAAGLLAGTVGAAAYAFVCRNDGGLFVFVWYGLGVSLAAALGACLGRRVLKW